MILAAIDNHKNLWNADFLILLFFLHLLVMIEELFLTKFLVTLKYSLYRNGCMDNYFFPFIYHFLEQWIIS